MRKIIESWNIMGISGKIILHQPDNHNFFTMGFSHTTNSNFYVFLKGVQIYFHTK